MSTCTATRRNGTPCQGHARGGEYCFAHDPALQEKRRAGSAAGGRNRATAQRIDRLTPAGLRPVLDKLFAALDGLEDGSVDPKVGAAMASVSSAIVRVYETTELAARLKSLEDVQRDSGAAL